MTSGADALKFDSVMVSGVTINYSWCHSPRKTLGIMVRPDKSVAVRVPLHTSAKDVRKFVQNKAEWVLKIWIKLDTRSTKAEQDYGRGAFFMYLGQAYRLEFVTGQGSSLFLHDGFLMMTVPEILTEEMVRKRIDAWYRKQAMEVVKERSVACHRMMHDQGFPLPRITIRPMKTRWGSYSYRTGRITLNLNLIKAPHACLDYVIIHELCHIKVRHHGPEFWRMVSRYVPNYLEVRNQLKNFL
jgi:predicted metal-dependent hydrolase